MASAPPSTTVRRYSTEELLDLRTSLPMVPCVINKLNKHLDLGKDLINVLFSRASN